MKAIIPLTEEEEQKLGKMPLTSLYQALEQVTDGRKKRGCRYSLALILTLALVARLAGETSFRATAHWIKLRKEWIIEQLQLKRASVPCLGTYLYALDKLDPQEVLSVVVGCVTRWEAEARCGEEPSRLFFQDGKHAKAQVAVDGKTLRGTQWHEAATQPKVHVVSVYEVHSGLVLAQRMVGEKENEITAVKDLLDPLYVKDRIWTADAMHTQKTTCQRLDQFGGKYVLFFKKNQPQARADLELYFQDPQGSERPWGSFTKTEKGHGRVSTRTLVTTTEMNAWFEREWAGVSQTFQLTRTVTARRRKLVFVDQAGKPVSPEHGADQGKNPKGKKTPPQVKQKMIVVQETHQQVVYGLTNLRPEEASPEALATLIRRHWAIENQLHWRRDVTLHEDHSPLRLQGRPQMLAVLNSTVLALLNWLGVRNVPEQMRVFNAFPHLAFHLLLGPTTFE